MKTKALELGCFKKCPETSSYNEVVTLGFEKECDVRMDVEGKKLPFKNEEFDFIWSHHFFEHISDTLMLIRECHRILKPDGKIEIHVPHRFHPLAWGEPSHKRAFSVGSFDVFKHELGVKVNYGFAFKVERRLACFNHPTQKEGSLLGKLIDKTMSGIMNLNSLLYDKHFSMFWIPEEIIFVLQKLE